jgi:glutathione S-transferase
MSTTDPRPTTPLQLHDFALSGHCHRVRLMLSLLQLPYQSIAVDLAHGEHKQPPFLALNPFGQVPVLRDGDVVIADSNAILVYLATRYGGERWLPRDAVGAAAVQRWLSVAAGEIAYGAAAARAHVVFGSPCDVAAVTGRARKLLQRMDATLARQPFLTGDAPTIADVAGYSYTAHAPEGDVDLQPYPRVRAWLARIEALPGFVPMPRAPQRASS